MKRGTKAVGKTHFLELSSLLHSIHNIHTGCFTSAKDSACSALVRYVRLMPTISFSSLSSLVLNLSKIFVLS